MLILYLTELQMSEHGPYVSNKVNWVENQDYWVERTKLLEDKLSDRLHEELTKSFY